jgi:hypothetical protein
MGILSLWISDAYPNAIRGEIDDVFLLTKSVGLHAALRFEQRVLVDEVAVEDGVLRILTAADEGADLDGALEVAQLKRNVGGPNYALPAGLDLGQFKSEVSYRCRFTTLFSTAERRS